MSERQNPILVITGGGTGGHLFPALAVAEAVQTLAPQLDLLFIGRDADRDRCEVERRKIPFAGLNLMGFKRRITFENAKALIRFFYGVWESWRTMRKHKTGVVFGVGGYVSAPAMIAGKLLRWPVTMHEQNTVPGLVNRTLARWCRRVFITFEASQHYFKSAACQLTGFPLRKQLLDAVNEPEDRESNQPLNVLLIGGSQGAKRLVEIARDAFAQLHEQNIAFRATVQTGERNFEVAQVMEWPSQVELVPFIHDMANVYRSCDIVISRAGAGSLSEIALWGCPAILVPYPYASGNHQEHNAQAWADRGAAILFRESELTPERLSMALGSLLADSTKRAEMSRNALALAKRDASKVIACDLIALLEETA